MALLTRIVEAKNRSLSNGMLAQARARWLRKDEPTDKDLRRAYGRGYRWRWIREHRSALAGILGPDGRVGGLQFGSLPYASKRLNAAFVDGANARLREAAGVCVPLAEQIYGHGASGRTSFAISVSIPPGLATDLGFGPHTAPHLTGRVRTGARLATDRRTGVRRLAKAASSFGDANLDAAYAAGLECFLAGTVDEKRPAPAKTQRAEFRIAASLSALAVLFGHWWP